MKLLLKTSTEFLTLLLLVLTVFLTGCQTFPVGERIAEIEKDYQYSIYPDISVKGLYLYYEMCRAAWRQRDSWKDSGWDLRFFHDEKTDTLGVFILEDEILYISFRSSRAILKDSVDLSYNSRIGLMPLPFLPESGIKAHRGFIEKYMSVRDIILQELVDSNPKEIILVGHSAGGAMASLAFIDIKHLYPDTPLNAVTFGMPRVFNSEGARWYSTYRDNLIRVVNGRDLIPHMPSVLFGYRHVGRLVRIGIRPWWKIYSIKDHHPGYSDQLEDLLRLEGIDFTTLGY